MVKYWIAVVIVAMVFVGGCRCGCLGNESAPTVAEKP